MEQIRLTSFGFTRCKEMDFSDDGNHFKVYTYHGARVTYLNDKRGGIYISARVENTGLTWDEYSKAPHYKSLDSLNGVSEDQVTPEALEQLKKDIDSYLEEIKSIKGEVKEVTDEEIVEYYKAVYDKKEVEFNKAMTLLMDVNMEDLFTNLSEYELGHLKEAIKGARRDLNIYTKEKALQTCQATRRTCINKKTELNSTRENYWLETIKRLSAKALGE